MMQYDDCKLFSTVSTQNRLGPPSIIICLSITDNGLMNRQKLVSDEVNLCSISKTILMVKISL